MEFNRSPRIQPKISAQVRSTTSIRYGFIASALTVVVLSVVFFSPRQAASLKVAQVYAGKVYQDVNENGQWDWGEIPLDSVKVRILIDHDGDGVVSRGDEVVDSLFTNSLGLYEWKTFRSETLVVEIDPNEMMSEENPIPVGLEPRN